LSESYEARNLKMFKLLSSFFERKKIFTSKLFFLLRKVTSARSFKELSQLASDVTLLSVLKLLIKNA
jgi:hypothetical protein